MQEQGSLARLSAGLKLKGISRREAAGRLHLSYSALNKKLRGQAPLTQREQRLLLILCEQEEAGQSA